MPPPCTTNSDCPGATGPCELVASGIPKACSHACTTATVAQDCGLYGECTALSGKSFCNGARVPTVWCDPTDYGQPVVAIDTLPGNKSALTQAIQSKVPDGEATPTQPSLDGALSYARQWAVAHPHHVVHVLFATDGLPNNCTFNTVQGAAGVAKKYYEGTPSVPTFVLGIGELSDLNSIAASGCTYQAVLADSNSAAQKMVDIFNSIRGNGECKFQLPDPAPGTTLDYAKVNVDYTPSGQTQKVIVGFVGNESQCDPNPGWVVQRC